MNWVFQLLQENKINILKYAYDKLGLDGMDLNVFSNNSRAIHCYEKVGFTINGQGKTEEDLHMINRKLL